MLSRKHVADFLKYQFTTASNVDGWSSFTTAYRVAKFYRENATGKIVLITGCNGGIGYQTACALLENGAELIMACRNSAKTQEAYNRITARYPSSKVTLFNVDTSNFESIRQMAKEVSEKFDHIDILINNAGVVCHEFTVVPENGFERSMATNFLGPVLITELLEPLLRKSPSSFPRVVYLSTFGIFFNRHLEATSIFSPTSENFVAMLEYGRSKYFLLEYAKFKQEHQISGEKTILYINAHPGVICTDIHRDNFFMSTIMKPGVLLGGWLLKNESQGAACSTFCTLCEKEEFIKTAGGALFADCKGPCAVEGPYHDASHMKLVHDLAIEAVHKVRKPKQPLNCKTVPLESPAS